MELTRAYTDRYSTRVATDPPDVASDPPDVASLLYFFKRNVLIVPPLYSFKINVLVCFMTYCAYLLFCSLYIFVCSLFCMNC